MWKACLFVRLSVTKSQQLNHFSGSYEIWCTSFFLMKSCQASMNFAKIGLLTALFHLKVSCNFYTRFTYFLADAGEILRRSAHRATEQLRVS
jgi:hypothetical protein